MFKCNGVIATPQGYGVVIDVIVLVPVVSHSQNCAGCHFEQQKTCDDNNSLPCGLTSWGAWQIWKVKGELDEIHG